MPEIDALDDRLRRARLAAGLSQGELAAAAGVSRQAVSGIEAGRWSPSLDVALALARTLSVSVEELFSPSAAALSIRADLAVDRSRDLPARRVLMTEVSGRTMVFPLRADGALVPGFLPAVALLNEDDDQVNASHGSGGSEHPGHRCAAPGHNARRIVEAGPTLSIAGCDPALPLLQGPLLRHKPPVGFVWWPCGNAEALDLLRRGAVHVAAVHRERHAPSLPREGAEVVHFSAWREGLALAAGHAKVKDLDGAVSLGLRFANRERGSEARRLLDRELRRRALSARHVKGYSTTCTAHLLVASAITAGLADAGVTTEPAALAFGLAFLPWSDEVSEFHIAPREVASVEVGALRDVLAGRELARQLAALDGYEPRACGTAVPAKPSKDRRGG